MNMAGFIFARGGSKGCPRKNVRPLGGVPLIGRAVRAALACPRLSRVIVSTDDDEIMTVAKQFGAEAPFRRPAQLATDDAPEWLAWRHAVEHYNAHSTTGPLDVFVSVPATAPLRSPDDIDRCLDLFLNDPGRPDVVLTVTTPTSNPYFSMLRTGDDGFANLAAVPPGGPVARRQEAPEVFTVTPVAYVVRPGHILQGTRMLNDRVKTVFVSPERAVDVDTELDFAFADFLCHRQVRAAA